MTSKPHIYARKITANFNLSKFLTHEFGSELNGKNTNKANLISEAMDYLKLAPQEAIMVGDRKFDIIGAKENSIRTVGVLWGYGSKDELEAELPDILIETPENLAKTILKMGN